MDQQFPWGWEHKEGVPTSPTSKQPYHGYSNTAVMPCHYQTGSPESCGMMQDTCSQMNPSRPCFFPTLLLRTFRFSQIQLFNISQVYPTSTFPKGIRTPQTDTELLVLFLLFPPSPLASDPRFPSFKWGSKLNSVPAAAPVPHSSARGVYLSSHSAPSISQSSSLPRCEQQGGPSPNLQTHRVLCQPIKYAHVRKAKHEKNA